MFVIETSNAARNVPLFAHELWRKSPKPHLAISQSQLAHTQYCYAMLTYGQFFWYSGSTLSVMRKSPKSAMMSVSRVILVLDMFYRIGNLILKRSYLLNV